MTEYALGRHADLLASLFVSAEVKIDGVIKPMTLTKVQDGAQVRVFINIPAAEVGRITRRIVKDETGQVVWDDPVDIVKPERDMTLEIRVEMTWKGGTP
ncbi:hypothetical protein LOK74_18960 [Brevibacillus humidisoli]|uniref:hypothetical protein n=1 Tax=Brevibacillus humidisoli TaxID=2895522 RepID=UPI001E2ABA24|nr:hypothetical protein [Brevibacillus humidisoli]UFJ40094.1 hypothetical protein LOK74_18960 [Brevibacillus humidisoli]